MVFIYVYGWWSIATVGDRNGVYMLINGVHCWSEDVCSWLTNCQVAKEVKGTGYMFSADADEQFFATGPLAIVLCSTTIFGCIYLKTCPHKSHAVSSSCAYLIPLYRTSFCIIHDMRRVAMTPNQNSEPIPRGGPSMVQQAVVLGAQLHYSYRWRPKSDTFVVCHVLDLKPSIFWGSILLSHSHMSPDLLVERDTTVILLAKVIVQNEPM